MRRKRRTSHVCMRICSNKRLKLYPYNTFNDVPSKILIKSGWRSLMKLRSSTIALSLIASVATLVISGLVCAQPFGERPGPPGMRPGKPARGDFQGPPGERGRPGPRFDEDREPSHLSPRRWRVLRFCCSPSAFGGANISPGS